MKLSFGKSRYMHEFMGRLVAFLSVCGFLLAAQGQAVVRLQNSSSTLVSLSVPGYTQWPPPGEVLYALLTAPVGTTDLTQFKPTGVLATNHSVAGRVFGETATVSGWPLGETRAFAIVGWFASLGTNFNPAWLNQGCNIGVGFSATGNWQSSNFQPLNPFTVLGTGFTISGPISPMLCPHISQSPVSQTVTQGMTVTFSVEAGSGYPPSALTYQWHFNGAELGSATNHLLVFTNVQVSQVGDYFVTVWNSRSAVSSAIATLQVWPRPIVPPVVTTPPRSQTAEIGDNVRLRVSATGDSPLAYRWVFNETNTLSHGADPELTMSNIQVVHSGVYTVVVTNAGGAVTSAPARLSVIVTVERRAVPRLSLSGQLGTPFNLEYSEALAPTQSWNGLVALDLTNNSDFYFDLAAPLPPQRFYRAWQTTMPINPPSLGLNMVPALTLRGIPGDQIRVEGINQFGPTDAWFTLATVTLTNTSQLYFDLTAQGQPARLYRLVPIP